MCMCMCSTSCGSGRRSRSRNIAVHPMHGGTPCGASQEEEMCNTQTCPTDCAVSRWASWTVCTKSCGTGLQSRIRSIEREADAGGIPCPTVRDERSCNMQQCPLDCEMSTYAAWSSCTSSCNSGTQSRKRSIIRTPQHGGAECPPQSELRSCHQPCCTGHAGAVGACTPCAAGHYQPAAGQAECVACAAGRVAVRRARGARSQSGERLIIDP